MIYRHGRLGIPPEIAYAAESIKHLNYKVTTPTKFQKNTLVHEFFKERIADAVRVPKDKLNYVYFSCSAGAEPHIDKLDPAVFADRTFVIPILLPQGNSILCADGDWAVCRLGEIYEFNHERIHSLSVEDIESGCVVIMASVMK